MHMKGERRFDPAKLASFIADLNQLRVDCKKPSYGDLERTAKEVRSEVERKFGKDRSRAVRELPRGTVQPMLAGRRVEPPPWALAWSFVSACRKHCLRNPGARLTGLGERTLDHWEERWKGIFETEEEMPASPAGEELSLSEERFLELYGKPGLELFRGAEEGGAQECLGLGVVLIVDGCLAEGGEWVAKADRLNDECARLLLEREDLHGASVELAVRLATRECGLALNATEEGRPVLARRHRERAALYLKGAVSHGNAEAAWTLALDAMGHDDYETAHSWFLKAMHLKYDGDGWLAAEWVNRTHQELLRRAPADLRRAERFPVPSLEELCEKASKIA